jgi:hypothetical protein
MATTLTDEELDQLFLENYEGGLNNGLCDDSLDAIWTNVSFDDQLLTTPARLPVNELVNNTSTCSRETNPDLEEAYQRIQKLEDR